MAPLVRPPMGIPILDSQGNLQTREERKERAERGLDWQGVVLGWNDLGALHSMR